MTNQMPPYAPSPGVPPRTSQLAVWSLILGLLFLLPPLGLTGLIFGIVAIVKISNSRGALTGKGYAIAGLVLGALSVIVTCACVPALLLLAMRSQMQPGFESRECTANLRRIGESIKAYRAANDGQMPPNLQTLVDEEYLPDPYILVCPDVGFDSALEPSKVDATSDYYYARLKDAVNVTSPVPIMWDKTLVHSPYQVTVLLSDGGVRFTAVSELKSMLRNAAESYESPPEVPTPRGTEENRPLR